MLDVVTERGELFLVMEYVHGESFAELLKPTGRVAGDVPYKFAAYIVAGVLHGLHAAHQATGERDTPLQIVHRDVSPQNVLVGVDGVPRVLDFGVAKAVGKLHATRVGEMKGKLRYMAPEQIFGEEVSPRTDIWATSVMLWEALTGASLFTGEHDAAILHGILDKPIPSPRERCPALPQALSDLVLAGLEREPSKRITSALEMAERLEQIVGFVPPRQVGDWVRREAAVRLADRERRLADLDAAPSSVAPASAPVLAPPPSAAPDPVVATIHRTLSSLTLAQILHGRRRRGRTFAATVALAIAAGISAFWLTRPPHGTAYDSISSEPASGSDADRTGVPPTAPSPTSEPRHEPTVSNEPAPPTVEPATSATPSAPPQAARRAPLNAKLPPPKVAAPPIAAPAAKPPVTSISASTPFDDRR
jgi:serine/threonine-protein kinase